MTITIKHAKHNNIADWTQAQLQQVIDGDNGGPLPPQGTKLADITLPSDWNDDHIISGLPDPTPPGGNANDIQYNNGAGGFAGTNNATLDSSGNIIAASFITGGFNSLPSSGLYNGGINIGIDGYYIVEDSDANGDGILFNAGGDILKLGGSNNNNTPVYIDNSGDTTVIGNIAINDPDGTHGFIYTDPNGFSAQMGFSNGPLGQGSPTFNLVDNTNFAYFTFYQAGMQWIDVSIGSIGMGDSYNSQAFNFGMGADGSIGNAFNDSWVIDPNGNTQLNPQGTPTGWDMSYGGIYIPDGIDYGITIGDDSGNTSMRLGYNGAGEISMSNTGAQINIGMYSGDANIGIIGDGVDPVAEFVQPAGGVIAVQVGLSTGSPNILLYPEGIIDAVKFVTTSGTSSQFVKGDGSLDSTAYLSSSSASSTYVPYTGATTAVVLGAHTLSTSSGLISPKIFPASDSTMAVQILKANGTTGIIDIDTTNSRVGINTTTPNEALEINGNLRFTPSSAGGQQINLYVGNSTVGAGDELNINGSNGFTGGNTGGTVAINSGNGSNMTVSGNGRFLTQAGGVNLAGGAGGTSVISGTTNRGGTGGAFNISGGAGGVAGNSSSSTTGGSGGGVLVVGGQGGSTSSTTASGTNIGGAGGIVGFTSGNGGSGGSGPSNGGASGNIQFTGGITGIAGTGFTGGAGGLISFIGSDGGTSTAGSTAGNTGGAGSQVTINTGNGGAATTSGSVAVTSGAGGAFALVAGNGGTVTGAGGTNTAGAGGALSFTSGNGGTTAGTGTPVYAAGGNISFTGGNGTSTSGSTAAGGSVYFLPGAGGPSGTAGNIYLGQNSSGTQRGTIIMGRPARLAGYTVATLPTGTQGDTAFCTDLLTPGFLVIAVGGGAVVGPVFFNGTNWVAY